jgi:alkanesulfonate monooxygenase SsuD/methylene tetrahydromethanopterin reductase-like flavin-dependent oxidoreductase (luciferase family)
MLGRSNLKFDVEIPTCREGVFVPAPFAGPNQIIELIKLAEQLGYYAVWGTDFWTPHSRIPESTDIPPNWYEVMISLSYAAAVTDKIKLGTGVVLLPYRDPIILAKQVATLDQFSNGRFLLGIGLGVRPEFEAINTRQKKAHRGRMLDEKLEALIFLLSHTQEEYSFNGEYVQFENVNLNPKPVQNPLPMYSPGRNPGSLRRIAKNAMGYMIRNSEAKDRLDAIEPFLHEYGRDISELDVVAESHLSLAGTHEDAVANYQNSRLGNQSKNMNIGDINKVIADNWIGTVSEVVQKIVSTKAMGISHYLALHIAGDTVEAQIEQMQIFAEEVIPQVESA